MRSNTNSVFLEVSEEVKELSRRLELAERAFHMVRGRIEKLVKRYETILESIDMEQESVTSTDPVDSSDASNDSFDKRELARRAQRAELKAEAAAKEVLIAKLEVEKTKKEAKEIRRIKQKELDELQVRLFI
jgi:hypothetical protein